MFEFRRSSCPGLKLIEGGKVWSVDWFICVFILKEALDDVCARVLRFFSIAIEFWNPSHNRILSPINKNTNANSMWVKKLVRRSFRLRVWAYEPNRMLRWSLMEWVPPAAAFEFEFQILQLELQFIMRTRFFFGRTVFQWIFFQSFDFHTSA